MAPILIVLINVCYVAYVIIRVVNKREGNHIFLYVPYLFLNAITSSITQFSVDGEMLTVASSIGCTVLEILMLYLVGYWAVDDMWSQYARVLESINVKNIVSIIIVGLKKTLLRTTFTGKDASYEDVIQRLFVFAIAILISEILLKLNLYGRIPSVIWKWLFISSFTVVTVNAIKIIFTGQGIYEQNQVIFIYLCGIIPALFGIGAFIANLILLLKNEVRQLEKYYSREYEKYCNRARQYETVRELRHDLANHLQVMSMLNDDKKQEYLNELMEMLNGNY